MRLSLKTTIVFAALAAAGCSASKSPAPPPTDSAVDDVPDIEPGDDDGSFEPSGTTYNYGPADVGDEETLKEIEECHAEGNVYDRYTDAGKCGKLKLAGVDCTIEALKALLTDNQKTQFNDNLNGKYDGYEIDQCGDCEKDSSQKACGPGDGKEGIIVFFVKEVTEEEEIAGLTMFLPHRKAHDPNGVSSSSGTIGDDESDEEDEAADEEDEEATDEETPADEEPADEEDETP